MGQTSSNPFMMVRDALYWRVDRLRHNQIDQYEEKTSTSKKPMNEQEQRRIHQLLLEVNHLVFSLRTDSTGGMQAQLIHDRDPVTMRKLADLQNRLRDSIEICRVPDEDEVE